MVPMLLCQDDGDESVTRIVRIWPNRKSDRHEPGSNRQRASILALSILGDVERGAHRMQVNDCAVVETRSVEWRKWQEANQQVFEHRVKQERLAEHQKAGRSQATSHDATTTIGMRVSCSKIKLDEDTCHQVFALTR